MTFVLIAWHAVQELFLARASFAFELPEYTVMDTSDNTLIETR